MITCAGLVRKVKCVTLLQIELNKDDFVPPVGWKWESDWYVSPDLR